MEMFTLTLFVLVTYCHVVTSDVPNLGPITYMTTKWPHQRKFVSRDDSVMISCETNQLYATVSLYVRYIPNNPWRNVMIRASSRVTVLGQTFVIKKLTIRDSGYYKCLARKWNGESEELIKGQLVVSPVKKKRIPEIFPDDPVIRVDLTKDRNITCKTIGARGSASFLTWYRKSRNGQLTKVDNARIYRQSELVAGNHIDIDKLMFKGFRIEDVGDYVCQRKVYNGEPTQKLIRVETKPVFMFKTSKWLVNGHLPIKMALLNDFLFISCQTSTPYANVILMRKQTRGEPWRKVVTSDKGHIMKIGQTFLVKKLSYRDSSFYKCRATNSEGSSTIELVKGKLIAGVVRSERPPEILPKVPILYIKRNGKQNIVCKADGFPGPHNKFLQWYRKNKYGEYIYVDTSKVLKQKIYVNGKHRDIHTLTFKAFNEDDVGEYICVRTVSGKKTTKAFINIKMKF